MFLAKHRDQLPACSEKSHEVTAPPPGPKTEVTVLGRHGFDAA